MANLASTFPHEFDSLGSQIFARKELNFERMTERDRKQIVAEVSVSSRFYGLVI